MPKRQIYIHNFGVFIVKKIGYGRVSTLGQDLQSQIQMLKNEKCDDIYTEKFTGAKTSRPVFNEVLELLNESDTLVVTKLDRFARTAVEGMQTVRTLLDRGVKVHVLNMGLIEDTPTGRLLFNVMVSFAEFERDMIIERTQEGKAIARQKKGYREGRKPISRDKMDHAMELLENHSYTEVVKKTGISKSTLIRYKKKIETSKANE